MTLMILLLSNQPLARHAHKTLTPQLAPACCLSLFELETNSDPSLQQHPVSWVPNADGTRLVGHMVLYKNLKESLGGPPTSSATILGLKVVGGKLLPNGRYGAIVEKVKKGSVADTIGHLLPGKKTRCAPPFCSWTPFCSKVVFQLCRTVLP